MKLEIVLVEPEIPQNTGNIARTCVATGARLHLVEPLGFSVADREVKRAGLDYWYDLDLSVWPDLDTLLSDLEQRKQANSVDPLNCYYVTTKGKQTYADPRYRGTTILFFGKETRGLPESLLQKHPGQCLRIPMLPGRRSLNLSNSVAIVAYEVLRQSRFSGMKVAGPSK